MGMRPNQGVGLEARKIGCQSGPAQGQARPQFEYCTCSPEGPDVRGACPWHRLCREARGGFESRVEISTGWQIGNWDFDIASNSCHLNSGNYFVRNPTDAWPTGGAQHHDRDFSGSQVLLVFQVRICGDQHLKPGIFCGLQQFAVFQRRPAKFIGCGNGVINNDLP
jgi:hypothetical protein